MRCLVLGGGGYLGSHLCESLLKSGYNIRIFEKENFNKINIKHILEHIEILEGDFYEPTHIQKAVKGVNIVFHLISTTLPNSSNHNNVYDLRTNVLPTLQLLDELRKAGIKKIIFFSSGGTVYGIPSQIPICEQHPTIPICSYGIHKLTIERYLYLYHYLYGLDYLVLRISNPYGGRQNPSGLQGAVTVFVNKALNDEPIEIWGDGTVIRDYIYISDVVDAAITGIAYNGEHKILNIGNGTGISLLEVIDCISNLLKKRLIVNFFPGRKMDIPINILDIKLAKKKLRWEPKVNFVNGVQKTIEFLSS